MLTRLGPAQRSLRNATTKTTIRQLLPTQEGQNCTAHCEHSKKIKLSGISYAVKRKMFVVFVHCGFHSNKRAMLWNAVQIYHTMINSFPLRICDATNSEMNECTAEIALNYDVLDLISFSDSVGKFVNKNNNNNNRSYWSTKYIL